MTQRKLRYTGLGAKSFGFVALSTRHAGPPVDVQGLRKLDIPKGLIAGWSIIAALQEEISMVRNWLMPSKFAQEGVSEGLGGTRIAFWGAAACLLVCGALALSMQIGGAQNTFKPYTASDPRLACLDEDIKEANNQEIQYNQSNLMRSDF